MTLSQSLPIFKFNLDTMDLLQSMGRSKEQTKNELAMLGLTNDVTNFMLSSRPLLNSILLRLQLYSEQKLSNEKIRSNLMVLNNSSVNSLLDLLLVGSPVELPTNSQKTLPVMELQEVILEEEDDEVPKQELSRFDQFFNACVRKTTEPTDIVKTTDFYNAFTEWWTGIYEEATPDKNDLKEFLNVKLGKSNKNTWSNVSLV